MPAFGKPASAASTTSLRRSSISASSPGSPVSANRGVWRVGVAKRAFPRPPSPPCATTTRVVGRHEIGDETPVAVEELRADGDAEPGGLAVCAVLLAPAAVAAPASLDPPDAPERGEVAERGVRLDDDVTAAPAVPAVRPALRDVLLAAEAQAAVAAAPRLDLDVVLDRGTCSRIEAEGCLDATPRGATEMKRFSPERRNSTVPSRSAKIVSSRPSPAPGPGRNFVPRCRTMIIPVLTGWPAKILTPSRFDSESRPLREEPRPFLCAI